MLICYLSTGSNLGDSLQYLKQAILSLDVYAGEVLAASPIYKTAPWGKSDQPDFYNQVLMLRSELDAEALLACCQRIEAALGRQRHERWAARTIDIDLLAIEQQIIHTETLCLPHPRLHERRFVLEPLCALAPDWWHPILNKTARTLLEECPDALAVERL